MTNKSINYTDIIDFWFSEDTRKHWWAKSDSFDQLLRTRFSDLHKQAKEGQLAHWRNQPLGRLAEIIVLDQFSRNMFRDQPESFTQDEQARELTRAAVESGADIALTTQQRSFIYMPLMHSESLEDHEQAVHLFASDPDLSGTLEFELKHMAIIERFGRYPHRNRVLGRESSPEELEFLQQAGSSF